MTTLLAWLRYLKSPGVGSYLLVLVSFACGLMSKPVLVTLPFVLLLLDCWPLRRWRFDGGSDGGLPGRRGEGIRRLVWEKLPLFGLMVVSSIVTLRVQAAGGAMRIEGLSPLDERIANAMTSYVAYVGKTLWPSNLACFYPLPTGSGAATPWTPAVAGAVVLVLSVFALGYRERARLPWLATGSLWYLGTLVPMIGLVQVGNQSMADRYAYIPTIGLYIILAGGLMELGEARARRVAIVLSALVFLVFALVTPRQVAVWRDGTTLFEHALAVTEDNYLAHYNLGTRLLRGTPARVADARPHLEAAVRLDPRHPGAHLNLGAVHWLEGRLAEASRSFEASLRLDPSDPEAHLSLGAARFEQGRVDESIQSFETAVALDPNNAPALSNLGTVLLTQGRRREAVSAFERALDLAPGMPEALEGLKAARGH
jgi:tetratricopeptide (TPR) repeat protein